MARFYWGVREDVNYLFAEGHHRAHRYPLAKVWAEARTSRRRMVNRIETEAGIMQATIATVFAKKGKNPLKAALKRLRDSEE